MDAVSKDKTGGDVIAFGEQSLGADGLQGRIGGEFGELDGGLEPC